MNWYLVIQHLQNQTVQLYTEIKTGKFDPQTAVGMMAAAEVSRILGEALLRGMPSEDHPH